MFILSEKQYTLQMRMAFGSFEYTNTWKKLRNLAEFKQTFGIPLMLKIGLNFLVVCIQN